MSAIGGFDQGVAYFTDPDRGRHHDLLAVRVNRRVGHLGELLAEEVGKIALHL